MDKFAKGQCKSPDKVQNSDQDSRLTDELQQILDGESGFLEISSAQSSQNAIVTDKLQES